MDQLNPSSDSHTPFTPVILRIDLCLEFEKHLTQAWISFLTKYLSSSVTSPSECDYIYIYFRDNTLAEVTSMILHFEIIFYGSRLLKKNISRNSFSMHFKVFLVELLLF